MSMNLNASIDGTEIPLMQTPTHVTYMCVVDAKGSLRNNLTGREAKRALHIYMQWAKSLTNGRYESSEDVDYAIRVNREHLNSILTPLSTGKVVKVWWT